MKHVVITGVSRGLGRAMAADFAADGRTVSGCGTDAAALQSLAKKLGPDHHLQLCDVTDPATVTERFGAPDLLLNNAATIKNPANGCEAEFTNADATCRLTASISSTSR